MQREDEHALVVLGELGRAHGLSGEVRLRSFTAEPQAIASYGALLLDDGRRLAIRSLKPASGGAGDLFVARLDGIATRTAAEALNGQRLRVARDRLPPLADEDEFLTTDLVGLAVEDTAGRPLGTVVAVPNYGGGDLLEIAPSGGRPSALLPFTKAFVPTVDLRGGRLVADAPEDLFEEAAGRDRDDLP